MGKHLLTGFAIMLALAALTMAADDPFAGTWKADVGKSSGNSRSQTKSDIVKSEAVDNGHKVVREFVRADGTRSHTEEVGTYDGKDHPYIYDSSPGAAQACTLIGDGRSMCAIKREGRDATKLFDIIAGDSKTGTLIFIGKDAQGKDFVNTLVYEKQ